MEEIEDSISSDGDDTDDEMMGFLDEGNESDDEEPYPETEGEMLERDHEETLKYRYIVLEGLSTASQLQAHFVLKWGVDAL